MKTYRCLCWRLFISPRYELNETLLSLYAGKKYLLTVGTLTVIKLLMFSLDVISYYLFSVSLFVCYKCLSLMFVYICNLTYGFTFMLPCIVIDFFLNNQPDALIIQIYSVIKLYMFRASSVPIIRSSLLYFRDW